MKPPEPPGCQACLAAGRGCLTFQIIGALGMRYFILFIFAGALCATELPAPATGAAAAAHQSVLPGLIVVNLAAGTNRASVHFDANTLLYSSANIDPGAGTNSTNGNTRTIAWTNKPGPGWSVAHSSPDRARMDVFSSKLSARFLETRKFGSNVAFCYTVSNTSIEDMPGLIASGGYPFFTRTLRIGATTNGLIVRLRDAGCDTLPPGVPCPSVVVLEGAGVQASLNTDRIEAVIASHTNTITAKFLFVDSQHGQAIPFDHLERIVVPDFRQR